MRAPRVAAQMSQGFWISVIAVNTSTPNGMRDGTSVDYLRTFGKDHLQWPIWWRGCAKRSQELGTLTIGISACRVGIFESLWEEE